MRAAGREPLDDPQRNKEDRGPHADGGVGRQDADEKGRHAHEDERENEHGLAAEPVAEVSGDGRAERPEEERDSDGCEGDKAAGGGARVLNEGVEEQRREDDGGRIGVNEEVVPLDCSANESAEGNPAVLRLLMVENDALWSSGSAGEVRGGTCHQT